MVTLVGCFFKGNGELTIAGSLSHAFLRAALLEEMVKYYFSYRVLKKNKTLGMKESILLAGLVGIGYGFTEKLFYGSGLAMIINGLFPGHMLFQWSKKEIMLEVYVIFTGIYQKII